MKKLFGFTLAETLLTITIIGVIAAVTLPILYANSQDQITINKVKKFNNIMTQAYHMAVNVHGPANRWNIPGESYNAASAEALWTYLKPYITVMEDNCGNSGKCYKIAETKILKGVACNGSDCAKNYSTSTIHKKVVLNDGSVMWFRTNQSGKNKCQSNICSAYWYDVNGDKEPNQVGVDIFHFYADAFKFYPHPGNDCNKNGYGWGCAKYIIKNGNMKYLDE